MHLPAGWTLRDVEFSLSVKRGLNLKKPEFLSSLNGGVFLHGKKGYGREFSDIVKKAIPAEKRILTLPKKQGARKKQIEIRGCLALAVGEVDSYRGGRFGQSQKRKKRVASPGVSRLALAVGCMQTTRFYIGVNGCNVGALQVIAKNRVTDAINGGISSRCFVYCHTEMHYKVK